MAEDLQIAAFGAAAAAVGYVGKLAIELILKYQERASGRKARLVALQSSLLASGIVFQAQKKLIVELHERIVSRNPQLRGRGFDDILSQGYVDLPPDEKMEHGLIRSFTEKGLEPLNKSMLDWLSKDDFFKGKTDALGSALQRLEAHLILWQAKYEQWIPGRPERAIVYTWDERQEGVKFPHGIEELIAKALTS